MNTEHALVLAAAIQLFISVLNLFLARILRWKPDLDHLPLLIREVFHVHSWFISLILIIFATMTLRFSEEMYRGTNPACTWLAFSIGAFWLFRVFLQFAYYSSSHWRGKTGLTLIHAACLIVYGGMSAVYLVASAGGHF